MIFDLEVFEQLQCPLRNFLRMFMALLMDV